MVYPENDRELRIAGLLDEALEEFRASGPLDIAAWQARYPDLAKDLPPWLEALQNVETILGDWKQTPLTGAAQLSSPEEFSHFLAPAQGADELGRLGPYRVLKVLGRGGMGIVFLAEDCQLRRLVALKAMRPAMALSAGARQRFLREARLAAGLKHDHAVTIYQVGEDRSVPFLAMEFLQGEPLDERLKREIALPVAEVLRIGREAAEGLAAAHSQGLIHRDIKPANVWLEANTGRVKILDFGLARATGTESHLTQQGAILGTPAYMAPEQAIGQASDARSDLFSLGCVLYRMAAGQAPFPGSDPMATIAAMALTDPKPLSEVKPEVPKRLEELVRKLLAKKPVDRPQSAQAVVEALADIEREMRGEESGPRVEADTCRHPLIPVGCRRRKFTAAALVLLAAMFLAGVAFTLRTRNGTLVVNVMEPDVEVIVDEDQQVTLDSKKVGKVLLIPGEHQLTVKRGQDELLTTSFTLKSGGEVVFIARWDVKKSGVDKKTGKSANSTSRPSPVTPPQDDAWLKVVAALPVEVRTPTGEQIWLQLEVVKHELKKRNPGFDGRLPEGGFQVNEGVITQLVLPTDEITDITPLRALTGLKELACVGSDKGKGKLADLSPVAGMGLGFLNCSRNQITDLTPLKSMLSLVRLDCTGNSRPIKDLSPLNGLPLKELHLEDTQVSDLSPLRAINTLETINDKPAAEYWKGPATAK